MKQPSSFGGGETPDGQTKLKEKAGGHGKRHRRHKDKQMQRETADSDRFYEQAMRADANKGSLRVELNKNEDNKQGDVGDEVNLKRSIEMKNGIALRSMNNFHKGTNAITLNNYKVSINWFIAQFSKFQREFDKLIE